MTTCLFTGDGVVGSRLRGRPRKDGLEERIIAAAGQLFISHGLQATRMDDIAQAAGIAKLTLYKRFQSKDVLFSAVIQAKCQSFMSEELFAHEHSALPEKVLSSIAAQLLALLTSREVLMMGHMLEAEASRHPELLARFYAAGPGRVKSLLANYLAGCHARGALHVADATLAAHAYTALIAGSDIVLRCKLHMQPQPDEQVRAHYCAYVAQLFVRAHEPRTSLARADK